MEMVWLHEVNEQQQPGAGNMTGKESLLLSVLNNRLNAIKNWMADDFSQLNADKTEILIAALPSLVPKIRDDLGSLTSPVKSSIGNLGVTLDQALTLDQHVYC